MSKSVPVQLKKQVAERANWTCEYCLRKEADSFFRFQVDHIISRKHGGRDELGNLAFSCPICNYNKGTDLGTILEDPSVIIPLFNPRKQSWSDHFEVKENGELLSKTETGRATIKLIGLNLPERVLERLDLIKGGLYP